MMTDYKELYLYIVQIYVQIQMITLQKKVLNGIMPQ